MDQSLTLESVQGFGEDIFQEEEVPRASDHGSGFRGKGWL